MRLTDSYRAFMGIPKKKPRSWFPERDGEIVRLYQEGQTLQQIGTRFGVTRERIRQVLKRNGLVRKDGGVTVNSDLRKLQIQASKDSFWIDKYGCNYASVKRIRVEYPKATRQFSMQRRNARQRGIDWLITLAEWMEIWIGSGHYYERGLGDGQYVMARLNDSGPYAASNVKIILSSENISEAMLLFKEKGKQWFGGKNLIKKTHCKRGHELKEPNLYLNKKTGIKDCLECRNRRAKEYYQRHIEKCRESARLRQQRKKLAFPAP